MAAMEAPICVTCGVQFPPGPAPERCPICDEARQYVGHDGQRWTTLAELARDHRNRVEEVEPGLTGIGSEPTFAIGQRALLAGGVLWDCISLLDDATAEAVERAGGITAIAVSHPHYYSSIVEWAERFDATILLHADDRRWVMRPSPRIEHWDGERRRVTDDVELVRLGGHFAGGTIALWNGALLCGDIVQLVSDRDWASFMYSYPNLIPLPAAEVERMRGVIAGLDFDRAYGAWWDRIMTPDAKAKILRSADRYVAALAGRLPAQGPAA
jgi:hypothetical protein